MPKSTQIDLVKSKSSLTDEILKWALSFGRLLIILVEIVAFSAFIYRFVLDRQIIDLNDKIKNEQAIIESSKAQETTYRNLHERLATAKAVTTTGNVTPKIVKEIVAKTPPEITYNGINISPNKMDLDVNVTSFPALTAYLKILKEYPEVTSVMITGIDNSSGGSFINVTLTATLKGREQ